MDDLLVRVKALEAVNFANEAKLRAWEKEVDALKIKNQSLDNQIRILTKVLPKIDELLANARGERATKMVVTLDKKQFDLLCERDWK